jgi:hypothetical protein
MQHKHSRGGVSGQVKVSHTCSGPQAAAPGGKPRLKLPPASGRTLAGTGLKDVLHSERARGRLSIQALISVGT